MAKNVLWVLVVVVLAVAILKPQLESVEEIPQAAFFYLWKVEDVSNKGVITATDDLESGEFYVKVRPNGVDFSNLTVITPQSPSDGFDNMMVGDRVYDDGFLIVTLTAINNLNGNELKEDSYLIFTVQTKVEGLLADFDDEPETAFFGSETSTKLDYESRFKTPLIIDFVTLQSNPSLFKGEEKTNLPILVKGNGSVSIPVRTDELSPVGILVKVMPRIQFKIKDTPFLIGDFTSASRNVPIIPRVEGSSAQPTSPNIGGTTSSTPNIFLVTAGVAILLLLLFFVRKHET